MAPACLPRRRRDVTRRRGGALLHDVLESSCRAVRVDRPDLAPFARLEEMPELAPEDLEAFSRMRGQLLRAVAPQ